MKMTHSLPRHFGFPTLAPDGRSEEVRERWTEKGEFSQMLGAACGGRGAVRKKT